ncbi:MAG TPA: ATP-binding protein [Steroidobacteraceae bacterium]|nr:ATP-binding protein [Steroidobacteraceae bacterium]
MQDQGELKPGRDLAITLAICAIAAIAIFTTPAPTFPVLHTILNTGIALVTVVLSLLFWDLGWRTGATLVRFTAILYAVVGVLEVLHVLAALEPSSASESFNAIVQSLRSGTWAPPAYLLPLGMAVLLWTQRPSRAAIAIFATGTLLAAIGLFVLFQWLPRYAPIEWLGIVRPTLLLVPLLWIPVGITLWRRRNVDRISHALAFYALGTALAHCFMLYSDQATSKFAMTAHFGVFATGLNLLLSLMQMGTADTARRMRQNEELEARVAARTMQLERLNTDLRREVGVRHEAEVRALLQLERLDLLRRITHAITERQDLASIIQVVVRSVEESLPADFVAIFDYQREAATITVRHVGTRSQALAVDLAMGERASIPIDQNGLSQCVGGQQVYEPDIAASTFPFPQRLAGAGLHSMVIVPLLGDRDAVFAVLVVARRAAHAFSSGECEFLRQLCEQVALAADQAQLHDSLQQAYENLKRTQRAVLEQERLRALGQMASGIAHDINNAISPVAVYVESLLTYESGFSDRARKQLQIIQRAVDDVARTVARMGEFYRRKPGAQELAPVRVERVLREVLDLTRARWSDMAQQRGVVIDTRLEAASGDATALGVESELREALVNLVLNAIDAMPEGGRLTLRAGRDGTGEDSRVFIEVTDSGIGMDEETRRRCLEPFFTTKGERGSGLGLAMVYGIAQRHAIEIDIVSAPGKGTTFRLTFPLQRLAASEPVVAVQPSPARSRILLIDDDPLLLTSLRDVLVREGHDVEIANGGRQGVDAFLESQSAGKPFPVVITDLGMPHFDGRAVATAIATASPGTPILMLTGWGQRLAATGEIPPEVAGVLSKPPRLAELRQALVQCLGVAAEED